MSRTLITSSSVVNIYFRQLAFFIECTHHARSIYQHQGEKMETSKLHSRLRAARKGQKLSLRQVATLSGHQISNAYLCELEGGKFHDPHPQKLRALSKILKIDFLELMILAGHLTIKDLKGKI
jgi:hypothetical protein